MNVIFANASSSVLAPATSLSEKWSRPAAIILVSLAPESNLPSIDHSPPAHLLAKFYHASRESLTSLSQILHSPPRHIVLPCYDVNWHLVAQVA